MDLRVSETSTPAEVRAEWKRWLLSGEFKQVKETLTSLDDDGNCTGHCCLGVLQEMGVAAGIAVVIPAANKIEADLRHYRDAEGGDPWTSLPTPDVREWAGLSSRDADLYAEANDDYGATFRRIAEVVEENTPRALLVEEDRDDEDIDSGSDV